MGALGRQWFRNDRGGYVSVRRVLRGADEVLLVDIAPAPMTSAPTTKPKAPAPVDAVRL